MASFSIPAWFDSYRPLSETDEELTGCNVCSWSGLNASRSGRRTRMAFELATLGHTHPAVKPYLYIC